jgi:hypothetical protein
MAVITIWSVAVIAQMSITCISHVQLHMLQLGHTSATVYLKKVVSTFIVLVD